MIRLKKAPSGPENGLIWVVKAAAFVAAIVLGGMMLLTVADVVGRYFFNHPIKGTWELIGLLLVCAGTWGLAYCQYQRAHISISIILARFPPRVQAGMRSFTYLVGLFGFSVICWRTVMLAIQYINMAHGVTDTLELPYAPFMLTLSFGTGLVALTLIVDLIHSSAEVIRK
jgi:TRAP-type C4-dicarboxylate transport system permease small subunit